MLENADVDTVGGLLAQQLGKVPLPGAVAEVAGLRLTGEGGKDARGRIRIVTVLVEQLERPAETSPARSATGPAAETTTDIPVPDDSVPTREESDARASRS